MYFTDGSHRAFESLMQNRPGTDHYDSGEDGPNEECRTCRFFVPGVLIGTASTPGAHTFRRK